MAELLPRTTTTRSTPITSTQPSIETPAATTFGAGFTTVPPAISSSSSTVTWTITHPPPLTTAAPPSTPILQSSTVAVTSPPTTRGSVPSTAFSEPGFSNFTTSQSVKHTPTPQAVPHSDDGRATHVENVTSTPTTAVVVTATRAPTVTRSAMTESTELGMTTDTLPKSKAKKISPPKKKPKDTLPPKVIAKKNGVPKNISAKDVPPKLKPKKKTNVPANENPLGNGPKNSTEKATSKTTAQKKTEPKKAPPKKTLQKSSFPKTTSPKNNTVSNNAPKKTPPKKTPVQKAKPPPKKNVVPKSSPKKNTPPKKGNTKPTQTKVNPTKKPKSPPTNVTNRTSLSQKKTKEKKTNPKTTTVKTTPSYYSATPSPFTNPEHMRDLSSTTPSYTSIHGITTETPFTESKVNDMNINNHSVPTKEALQWNRDAFDATSSTSREATTAGTVLVEDGYIPSGTAPYGETTVTNSGDAMVTSGILLSDDDIAVSYSNVGVASDTMVLDDGLTMVIPTIRSEDMTDLVSSPWLDLTEYIPVTIPVPMSVPDVAATTMEEHIPTVTSAPTLRAGGRPDESSDSNSIDVLENRGAGTEHDVSANNLIPKRRVNFRERTKNKRIQELLEEKRNFLLRTKRGHAP